MSSENAVSVDEIFQSFAKTTKHASEKKKNGIEFCCKILVKALKDIQVKSKKFGGSAKKGAMDYISIKRLDPKIATFMHLSDMKVVSMYLLDTWWRVYIHLNAHIVEGKKPVQYIIPLETFKKFDIKFPKENIDGDNIILMEMQMRIFFKNKLSAKKDEVIKPSEEEVKEIDMISATLQAIEECRRYVRSVHEKLDEVDELLKKNKDKSTDEYKRMNSKKDLFEKKIEDANADIVKYKKIVGMK